MSPTAISPSAWSFDVLPLLLCRFAQTSAAVLLAGTSALRLLSRGTGSERPAGWKGLAWGSWSVLLIAGVLQLGLTAAEMSGVPLAQAFSGEVLGSILGDTSFGAVWKVRAGLLAGLFVVGCFAAAKPQRVRRDRSSLILEAITTLLAAAFLASLVWSGHARASDEHAWLLPVDGLHAIAAGAWPGGLLPLALLLARTRRDPTLIPMAATVTRRFSRLSGVAVGILAFSGSLNSCGLIGTFPALWTSAYGRWILCKAALFAGMVVLGAANRRLLARSNHENSPQMLAPLWRNVAWECALAVCVLLATEALAISAPPVPEG